MEEIMLTICDNLYYKSVGVSKLQVAILARSSREMSQTVRIDLKHILPRVRVSVRPSNFCIRKKHPKLHCIANTESPAPMLFHLK